MRRLMMLAAVMVLGLAGAAFAQGSGAVNIGKVEFGTGGPFDSAGSGSPEGALTAPVGSIYRRTNGGAGTVLYVKESGTGSTGWVAYSASGGGGGGSISPAYWSGWNFVLPADLVLEGTSGTDSSEIRPGTADGNDWRYVAVGGGGSISSARGGYTVWRGNEHAYHPGAIQQYLGNVAGAYYRIVSQNVNVGTAFNVAADGKVRLNDYGITAAQSGDQYLCYSTDTSGTIHRGATCNPSSARFKTNIQPLTHGLDWLAGVQPVTFDRLATGKREVGFVAENVHGVDPRLAIEQEGEVFSTDDRAILALTVKALQELQGEVARLKAELAQRR